jgi:hypothetical protein
MSVRKLRTWKAKPRPRRWKAKRPARAKTAAAPRCAKVIACPSCACRVLAPLAYIGTDDTTRAPKPFDGELCVCTKCWDYCAIRIRGDGVVMGAEPAATAAVALAVAPGSDMERRIDAFRSRMAESTAAEE